MPEVLIDGEEVVFEGALPASLGELRILLEDALAAGDRVLAGLVVDGREYTGAAAGIALSGLRRVEARSLSVAAAVAELASAAADGAEQAAPALEAIGAEVLRAPWEKVRPACLALAERVGNLLADVPALVRHAEGTAAGPGLREGAEALSGALGRWIDAIAAGDASGVCLRADHEVRPALAAFRGRLREMKAGPP